MTRTVRRAVSWLAIPILLAAAIPLQAQEARKPCTLAELEEALGSGGIGGTGILAQDGGIGGTGIVGTITGFGSVCVNGVEVHYDGAVAVTADGAPSDAAQLAIGQAVAIEVSYAQGGLHANSIAILGTRPWAFHSRVTRLWLEGILERRTDGDVLLASGRAIRLAPGTERAGSVPGPGSRMFVLAKSGAGGALVAERIVVPSRASPRGVASPAPPERRAYEPARDFRMEPRIEPRPSAPAMPGRMGR